MLKDHWKADTSFPSMKNTVIPITVFYSGKSGHSVLILDRFPVPLPFGLRCLQMAKPLMKLDLIHDTRHQYQYHV
jgi:hypothetical protein